MIKSKLPSDIRRVIDPKNTSTGEDHLANLCKEWSYIRGFTLRSGKDGWKWSCVDIYNKDAKFFADTESESVFKAIQWVFKISKDNYGIQKRFKKIN